MATFPTLARWGNRLAGAFASRASRDLMTPTAVWSLVDQLFSFEEPDEILRKAGKDRTELRRVVADDEVATAVDTRLAALVGTPIRLDQSEGPVSEFVWPELERHGETVIEGAFSALLYGYSVIERVWVRRDDGRLVVAEIDERPFEWFSVSAAGGLTMRVGPQAGAALDTVDKFILTRHRASYRNPRGQPLLSRVYWPWFLRSAGWRMWARFLERNASPLMVGMGNNTKTLAEALAAAVNSGVLAVAKDEKVERLDSGQRGEAYQAFSDQVDRRIQKAILGQTLTTDVRGAGSYAAAKVHDLVRMDRRLADVRMVRPALQAYVDSLVRLNFGPGAKAPRVLLQDQAGLEMERAQRDAALAETGQIRFTEAYFLARYDFEPGEIKVVEPGAPGSAQDRAGAPAEMSAWRGARFATASTLAQRQADIDALADDALELTGSPIRPADIRAALKVATGPEDLIDRLEALAGDLPSAAFTALVERALFAAEVVGYVHDSEGGGE